jgi:tRNA(fMet)-specific endonuclease VapC
VPTITHYLLDTHHATALWRGHSALVTRIDATPDAAFHLCVPTIGELWYRVWDSVRPAEHERTLIAFLGRSSLVQFDDAAAIEFGRIKTALRKISRPISEIDAQIAAIALARDMTVLSADQHFSVISGLRVANWLAGGLLAT